MHLLNTQDESVLHKLPIRTTLTKPNKKKKQQTHTFASAVESAESEPSTHASLLPKCDVTSVPTSPLFRANFKMRINGNFVSNYVFKCEHYFG